MQAGETASGRDGEAEGVRVGEGWREGAGVAGGEAASWGARAAGNSVHGRWGADSIKAMREAERQLDQLRRREIGIGQAARVDSSSGQGAGWVFSAAAVGGADLVAEASPEGPPIPRGEIGYLQLSDAEERVLARFRLGLFERPGRSEVRRVGEECRTRWSADH